MAAGMAAATLPCVAARRPRHAARARAARAAAAPAARRLGIEAPTRGRGGAMQGRDRVLPRPPAPRPSTPRGSRRLRRDCAEVLRARSAGWASTGRERHAARRDRLHAVRGGPAALRELRARGTRLVVARTGTCRCTRCSTAPGCAACSTARSAPRRSARPSRTRRDLRARRSRSRARAGRGDARRRRPRGRRRRRPRHGDRAGLRSATGRPRRRASARIASLAELERGVRVPRERPPATSDPGAVPPARGARRSSRPSRRPSRRSGVVAAPAAVVGAACGLVASSPRRS